MKKRLNRRHDDVSLSAFELFRSTLGKGADFKSHLTEDIDPTLFHSAGEFLPEYWAVESFSKMPVDIGINREAEAIRSFLEAEDLCKAATPRFTFWETSSQACLIKRIQRRIKWLVADICPTEVFQRARWSGGATSSLPAKLANPQNKWGLATHVTNDAAIWMQLWNDMYHDQAFANLTIVDSNRVLTVPKNAKTDRVIAAEPDWNMFLQLGLGACIRRRLQRVGLLKSPRDGERVSYHNDAQTRQQHFARIGSSTGNYATIDLKAASDSISLAVSELLCPRSLWSMLWQLRSPCGVLPDGTKVTYEKVSSMGNGTTFELETLLFWAIACETANSEDVLVYGDDIIVPTESAPRVVEALEWFGFRTNPKKTHTTGFFRESCGGHYFNGADVTPPYFRKNLDCLTAIISGYNSLCQRVAGSGVSCVLQRDLMDGLGAFLRRQVPMSFAGPPGLDGCLGLPYHEFLAVSRRSRDARARQRARSTKRNLGHASGFRFVEYRPLAPAVPEWGLVHALYSATEASRYNTPGTQYRVQPWSAEPWSTLHPF